ncbi:MAG: cyanophycinase [Planctomycetes bacterium]|jgi:cyanophycinase|nr:cyanophycinase [Planctomycetota bacterium]MBT4029207.1 cyanophycinase [Planctomycetota bacterium]MBT4559288.1 cyanophycinase [Planctomycetota bacterium]MBT7012957.1 cyanophycinase [Planctomycetota bacterium]MBT7318435.1 cyanophycinase [Planctomycetota bacterium]
MSHGYIIPIGGAEEKIRNRAILRRFVDLCGGSKAKIAIIPTASRLEETGPRYVAMFEEMGVAKADSLSIETRQDCTRSDYLSILQQADGLFITGGNQLRLSTTIGGTTVSDILRNRNLHEGLHVAGTSAGASIMSEHMIAYGSEGTTPRCDMVALAPGFGLTHDFIVDQHFHERNRLGRLLTALAFNPRPLGLGLDEDTAAFISGDGTLEVVGTGGLTIVDPSQMDFSSMDSASRHDPLSITNIVMHVLTHGHSFDIQTRKANPQPTAASLKVELAPADDE